MPNIKSAKKRVKVIATKTQQNKATRSYPVSYTHLSSGQCELNQDTGAEAPVHLATGKNDVTIQSNI